MDPFIALRKTLRPYPVTSKAWTRERTLRPARSPQTIHVHTDPNDATRASSPPVDLLGEESCQMEVGGFNPLLISLEISCDGATTVSLEVFHALHFLPTVRLFNHCIIFRRSKGSRCRSIGRK